MKKNTNYKLFKAEILKQAIKHFFPIIKTQTMIFFVAFEGEKYQVIDLEEYQKEQTPRADIELSEWYTARNEAGCLYHMVVYLVSAEYELVDIFKTSDSIQVGRCVWRLATHRFKYDSAKGTPKYLIFYHAGKVGKYKAYSNLNLLLLYLILFFI